MKVKQCAINTNLSSSNKNDKVALNILGNPLNQFHTTRAVNLSALRPEYANAVYQ